MKKRKTRRTKKHRYFMFVIPEKLPPLRPLRSFWDYEKEQTKVNN